MYNIFVAKNAASTYIHNLLLLFILDLCVCRQTVFVKGEAYFKIRQLAASSKLFLTTIFILCMCPAYFFNIVKTVFATGDTKIILAT